jgi:hypothetical protein
LYRNFETQHLNFSESRALLEFLSESQACDGLTLNKRVYMLPGYGIVQPVTATTRFVREWVSALLRRLADPCMKSAVHLTLLEARKRSLERDTTGKESEVVGAVEVMILSTSRREGGGPHGSLLV